MAAQDLPKPVANFLAEHIDSVVQLEILLLMQAAKTALQAPDVAREMRIDAAWTEAALAKLAAAGILQQTGASYQYAPRGPLADTIETLATEYTQRRVSVVAAIFSKPPDAIRKFTDAFRFRKDEEH